MPATSHPAPMTPLQRAILDLIHAAAQVEHRPVPPGATRG